MIRMINAMKRFWNKKNTDIKIKICNMKYLDVAYESAQLGADALGFHIWKNSDIESKILQFQYIIRFLPNEISCWMLTDITEPHILRKILDKVEFDTVQFQGRIGISKLQQLICKLEPIRRKKGLMIVKTVSIDFESEYEDIFKIAQIYSKDVDALLLDSKRKGSWEGGTGIVHNWNLSAELIRNIDKVIILAGGLTPENIIEAIIKVKPYGVDVESGVEMIVGKYKNKKVKCKCIMKIKEFIRKCKECNWDGNEPAELF